MIGWIITCGSSDSISAQSEEDYYRIDTLAVSEVSEASRSPNWKPAADGIPLEIGGMAFVDEDRLAVTIRKGEVWILSGLEAEDPDAVRYHRFASALHEPLGLLKDGKDLLVMQRTELTRLQDRDGDGVADAYLTEAAGWGVTGHYHEYAYGPERDGEGALWMTLNIGLGLKGAQLERTVRNPVFKYRQGLWRGWGLQIGPNGQLLPVCAGMRSPAGLGANAQGDMFYTDQQGNWVPTNSLHHMRPGVFLHHAEALASAAVGGPPWDAVTAVPAGLPYPDAVTQFSLLQPPAVWFPYQKAGQSATDIECDRSGGDFGPFADQLFVGEFTQAAVNRVYLEKVNGEYQGACFPFRSGFASAVLRLEQDSKGRMYAGLTNRGWSSLGRASYGLQRIVWTGRVPFEILKMEAQSDGFLVTLTKPVDRSIAEETKNWKLKGFTYLYHSAYGSDEIQTQPCRVLAAEVSEDGLQVRLRVDGLREGFVHELTAENLRSQEGLPLLHAEAWYTLNSLPRG